MNDENRLSHGFQDFESMAATNGEDNFWSARQLLIFLGYADYSSFRKPLERAQKACLTLSIPLEDNFRHGAANIDGREVTDLQLSRFACYLVAVNGDPKKPQVARLQVYLAGLANTVREYFENAEQIERLIARGDLSDEEVVLSRVATAHGVTKYAFFQAAGYRGMYNMNMAKLRQIKGAPGSETPLDYMHSEELAANLFRITQTRAKIESEDINGQVPLESAAESVGKRVRSFMLETSGHTPESLPAAEDITRVKTGLKKAQRTLKKFDGRQP